MCPPERLHITGEGITVYMIDCLRIIIGNKGVGKILLNNIEKVHHMLNHQLRRNSEHDIPRGSVAAKIESIEFRYYICSFDST